MKRLLILSILILTICYVSFGQRGKRKQNDQTIKWLSIGLKAGYGNSIFFNSEDMSDKNITYEYLTPSSFFGAKFGLSFGENIHLSYEFNSSSFGQKYSVKNTTFDYDKELKLTSTDHLILLSFSSEFGFYFEIGPKFSTFNTVTESNSNSLVLVPNNLPDRFQSGSTSLVAGVGFAAFRSERVSVNLGLRFNYFMSNIIKDDTYFIVRDSRTSYTSNKTNPLLVQLTLELKYFFAFWGDASCGRGSIQFFK